MNNENINKEEKEEISQDDTNSIEELSNEIENLNEQLIREKAENENIRKRFKKELEDAHKAEGKTFKHLANIFDVYTHPSGDAGFYEVEDLVSAPQEVHQALGSGENLYDIGEYIIGGDEKNLANTPKEVQAGGKTFKLHDFFKGVRKDLLSAGIDPDNVDLLGGEHNIMMTKSGNLKLIDY